MCVGTVAVAVAHSGLSAAGPERSLTLGVQRPQPRLDSIRVWTFTTVRRTCPPAHLHHGPRCVGPRLSAVRRPERGPP